MNLSHELVKRSRDFMDWVPLTEVTNLLRLMARDVVKVDIMLLVCYVTTTSEDHEDPVKSLEVCG